MAQLESRFIFILQKRPEILKNNVTCELFAELGTKKGEIDHLVALKMTRLPLESQILK